MSVHDRLDALGITLPPLAVPAAAYVPFVRSGKLVFISGHIAQARRQALGRPARPDDEHRRRQGRGARDRHRPAGHAAGRVPATSSASARIVKVMSLVNSTPTFTEQHLVTNGCSELLGEVFGAEVGAHARSAFGVAQIPLGACVEIELIAELDSEPAPHSEPHGAAAGASPCCSPGARWPRRWSRSTCSTCSPAPGACCSG